jgi:outer membrane protein
MNLRRFRVRLMLGPVLASAAFIVVACWAGRASAQGVSNQPEPSSTWGLGVGAAVVQQPYRGVERKTTGLPLISYDGTWINVSGPRADLKLLSAETISLRLRARYAGDGYDADDSPFLAGMRDRKSSLWLGGAAVWRTDIATFTGELLGDALRNSKGLRLKLQADRRFPAGAFGFTPRMAVEWLDRKFVNYYYGVRPEEVLADRAPYEGASTANLEVGVRTDYSPSRNHSLFVDVGTTRLGKGIKDSPLVARTGQTTVSAGYLYRF